MPLGAQALLPFLALLVAATLVSTRRRQRANGWIAVGGTAVAAGITLVQLLRLAPGERVDVPYLTSFPYADLAIRLDALSLSFATITLTTAALLMLARVTMPGDRRDPWISFLLTSVAVLGAILAQNLLLTYILLQLLTLAWSGTLDESAPRRRRLRLAIVIADIGLLLAAAGAIQSVGTSAFSGVPSDTFGPAAFLLALLAVLTRLAALAWPAGGSMAPVAFEPAVAWAAPAAYLLVRLIALMGGRLPGRPFEVLVFGGGLTMAAGAALWTIAARPAPLPPRTLLIGHAGLALALIASPSPLLLVASIWLWLQLILLAGLCSLRLRPGAPAGAATLSSLAIIPGSGAFVAIWIAVAGLRASGQLAALLLVAMVVVAIALAGLTRLQRAARLVIDVPTGWAAGLLLLGALPIVLLGPLVLPAAQTVRAVSGGTVLLSPVGFTVAGMTWPALLATLVMAGGIGTVVATGRFRVRIPRAAPVPRLALGRLPRFQAPTLSTRWATRTVWSVFTAAVLFAVLHR